MEKTNKIFSIIMLTTLLLIFDFCTPFNLGVFCIAHILCAYAIIIIIFKNKKGE